MPRSRVSGAVAVCVGSVITANVVLSQTTPLGSEFQANSYTAGEQYFASVALESNGDFVVAWESADQDGAVTGVFARRFSSAGAALANEFQVNAYTTYGQDSPAVASDSDGDFVVAWSSYGQDGSLTGIFARRFSSAGAALANEFQVNTYTSGAAGYPVVSMDGAGDFVVAWGSYGQDGSAGGVFARRFSSAGTALGGELLVNTYTMDQQRFASVATDADGDFVVVWNSYGQDGSGAGVFARRFSSAGAPVAFELQVTTYTTSYQWFPAVTADADGDFVVAWSSDQDGFTHGVFARRFSSAGAALASEFQVNTYTEFFQGSPSVAADADGGFVVAWQSVFQDFGLRGIFARRFSSAGAPATGEFLVNSFTDANQRYPSVAVGAGGHFVVAWESYKQDGDDYGIFAQRFGTLAVLDIDGNGSTGPLTDGLLVLRFLFGFTGATLVSGAVDVAGCTRCTAPPIQAYLETLI